MLWLFILIPIVAILIFAVWFDKRNSFKEREYTENEHYARTQSQIHNYNSYTGGDGGFGGF